MNTNYEAFCLVDRIFYDAPSAAPADSTVPVTTRVELPEGWSVSTSGVWTVVLPAGGELPPQGWKIHVSACRENARRVLETSWEYCVAHRLFFKFLSTPAAFMAQNAKYAERSGSGKFITIYPVDEAELGRTLVGLGALLRGEPGPYILSDLRWEDGPLYVRYGGFTLRECPDEQGELVPAIENPAGQLVPDERVPVFQIPEWIEVPPVLAPAIERRDATAAEPFPYEVTDALHFSNGGGVYLANDPGTGNVVVLKEARPFAGLDANGKDAVARLDQEHRMLETLAGLGCVPKVHDYLTLWEHRYLVEEHIEGPTLHDEIARRYPLIHPNPSDDVVADYTRWALAVVDHLDNAVQAVHERGVVLGDLHPRNVIVRPDGSVCLIDFELAHGADEPWTRSMGAPGFVAPPECTGVEVDRFAIGAIRLAAFLPLTELVTADGDKLDELLEAVTQRFPVPTRFASAVRRDIVQARAHKPAPPAPTWRDNIWPRDGLPRWESLRTSMTSAILASATPERADRLFPGDPAQFGSPAGGLALAYGAAGVLWALHETGAKVNPAHLDWLVRSVAETPDTPLGFYDGMSGIAYALHQCGRQAEGLELMASALGRPINPGDPSLFSGTAGIGLALLYFSDATGDDQYLHGAIRMANAGIDVLDQDAGMLKKAGLMRGWSGLALLLIRLYERVGEPRFLDAASRALHADLDQCVLSEDGTLQVDEGWRLLPYVEVGSAGIGVVLNEFLSHRPDDSLAGHFASIEMAASPEFVIQSGLFNGRAGLLLFLRRLHPTPAATIRSHVARMAWHAVSYRGHAAFPGDQLARLSMDLATGSAGVLLALAAVLGERPVTLPFLHPAPYAHGTPDSPSDSVPGERR